MYRFLETRVRSISGVADRKRKKKRFLPRILKIGDSGKWLHGMHARENWKEVVFWRSLFERRADLMFSMLGKGLKHTLCAWMLIRQYFVGARDGLDRFSHHCNQ